MKRHPVRLLDAPEECEFGWCPPSGEVVEGPLHARVLGAGDDAVVLLHGLAGSNRYFGAAYDALATQRQRLVVPDLLGFGSSPRPHGIPYGPDDHVSALTRLLDALEIRQPIHLVGHSAGALVALHLANRSSARIRSVVALSPPLYADAKTALEHIRRIGLTVRFFATDGPLAHMACRWMCSHRETAARISTWLRRDLPEPIARDGVQHHWESYSGTLRNLILEARVPAAGCSNPPPTLLIAGDEDRVLDLDYLRDWTTRRPGAELEVWPGDHDLPLRTPIRTRGRIREWHASHEG